MFSVGSSVNSGSRAERSTRRRHRTTSGDSVSTRPLPKRRKRSSIAPDTFDAPQTRKSSVGSLKLNGSAAIRSSTPPPPPPPPPLAQARESTPAASADGTTSLAVRSRGGKRGSAEKRTQRHGDGAVLTKTEHYVVTKELDLPEELNQLVSKSAWHAQVSTNLGYAVATTHSKVIIWRYRQRNASSENFKALTIQIDASGSPSSSPSRDSLPLATLVHDSGVGELALFLVTPAGEVSYWESVATAASADETRQRKIRLHSNIPGLLSGELVLTVTDAEPDGFVLSTNAGRVIHVSVRDPQGRPAVSSQLLRSDNNAHHGLFGSIRNAITGSGWRREIAAVRMGPLHGKSHRQCLVATTEANFQVWDLVRHSNRSRGADLDGKAELENAVTQASQSSLEGHVFSLMDFTLFPNSAEAESQSYRLLGLVCMKRGGSARYFLVDITLKEEALHINVVHSITCWTKASEHSNLSTSFKPRVLLPSPAHTAIAIFDRHLVFISLSQVEQTPSSQLQIESNILSDPFQDILFYVQDSDYDTISCSAEPSDGDSEKASCLIFVHGFGLVSAVALPSEAEESVLQRREAACRSKIEQAVFFGPTTKNLFDFRLGVDMADYSSDEIGSASLAISKSILDSTCPFVHTLNPSTEHQLKQRATAVAELIRFVKGRIASKKTKWELLWNAEKVAAIRAVWKVYNSQISSQGPDDKSLLAELLDMMHPDHKAERRPDQGETDIVRHQIIHNIWNAELVIAWAEKAVQELHDEGVVGLSQQTHLVYQALNIQIAALEAAFRFRESNAELYGIGKDVIDNGIYQGDFKDLGQFWTSVVEVVFRVEQMAIVSQTFALEYQDETSPFEGDDFVDMDTLTLITELTPRITGLFCQVYEERCRYKAAFPGEQAKSETAALRKHYIKTRRELFVQLVNLRIPVDAFNLGEKYADVVGLAEIYCRVEQTLEDVLTSPSEPEANKVEARRWGREYKQRTDRYYKIYGFEWAEAYYSKKVEMKQFSGILDKNGPFLTEFLRNNSGMAKVSWIHDVVNSDNFGHATLALIEAQTHEPKLWKSNIELNFAKLAALAAREKKQGDSKVLVDSVKTADHGLAVGAVQQRLYAYVRPTLRTAIDSAAEVDLAMESFGAPLEKKSFFWVALRSCFEKLTDGQCLNIEELVNTLTLIDPGAQSVDEEAFASKRFQQALRLVGLSDFDDESKLLFEKIVWRRCFIQNDWIDLNRTENKNDQQVAENIEQTVLFKTLRAGLEDVCLRTPILKTGGLERYVDTRRLGFFENHPPLSPSEVQSAGTTPDLLRKAPRFAEHADSTLKAIAAHLSAEDDRLVEMVDKGRLAEWWPSMVESAKSSLRRDADERGAEEAIMEEERRAFDESLGNITFNAADYTSGVMEIEDEEEEEDDDDEDEEEKEEEDDEEEEEGEEELVNGHRDDDDEELEGETGDEQVDVVDAEGDVMME